MLIFSKILHFWLVYRPPLEISHQPLNECVAVLETELQAPAPHFSHHSFRSSISICDWSGDVHVVETFNVKLNLCNTLILKAKINTTHVALNISSKAGN